MLKLTKFIILSIILGLFITPGFAQQLPEKAPRITHYYPDLEIEVWIDKGEGAVYHPGEKIRIFFQTSEDCYVLIYNIDTRGYVNILYPYDYSDPHWVSGGIIYRIPNRYADYQLRIDGPEGTEYIQAICSSEPIDLPNWPRYMGGFRDEDEEVSVLRLEEDEDPYDFIQFTNEWMMRNENFATDLCILTVEYPHPRWYYWPRTYHVERPWHYELGACYIHYPYGAEIYIDGVFYGITPITIPYLIMGRHFITVYFSGCRVFWDWVWIYPERTIWVRPPHFYDRARFVYDHPFRKEYRVRKEKSYRLKDEKSSRRRSKMLKTGSEKYVEKGKRTKNYTKRKARGEKRTYYKDFSKSKKDDFKFKPKKTEHKVSKKIKSPKIKRDKKTKAHSSKKIHKQERKVTKSKGMHKGKSIKKKTVTVKKTKRRR